LDIFDGTNVDSMPTDVIVDEPNSRAYIYLAGTGGIAVLSDPGPGAPTPASISFVGVAALSASQTDTPGSGHKIVLDSTRSMIYGISRLGRQVFTIDTNTWAVNALATDKSFDAILTVPQSNLTVVVDRTGASVYKVK
jgi:hypothetical protein